MIAVLLATWLKFTLPAYQPVDTSGACLVQGRSTLEVLSAVKLYTDGTLKQSHAPPAGFRDSFQVSTGGVHCVSVVDLAGNESCRTCVTLTTDAPPAPGPAAKLELFDLTGRRVTEPLPRGIYWQRVAGTKRAWKVVVVR